MTGTWPCVSATTSTPRSTPARATRSEQSHHGVPVRAQPNLPGAGSLLTTGPTVRKGVAHASISQGYPVCHPDLDRDNLPRGGGVGPSGRGTTESRSPARETGDGDQFPGE